MMRIAISRLHSGLSFVALSLHVLLILFAPGCGPVCTGTSGSCLNLRVDGSTSSSDDYVSKRLSVWLGGTDFSGAPIVVSGMVKEQGFFPTNLLIQPPPSMRQVDRVSVQLLGWRSGSDDLPSGSLLLSGRTNLYWPDDAKIEAAVNLDAPAAPFSNREDLSAGKNPRSVVMFDADHNGQMDLVVRDASENGESILLLLANEDGSFQPAQTIFQSTAGHMLSELAAADLDADHHADLVFADVGTGMVHVLYGKGDGSFFDPVLFYSRTTAPRWLSAADLDGDHREDLLIAGKTGALKILWNGAEAGFIHNTVLAQGNALASVSNGVAPTLIDVNRDGMIDVIAAGIDGSSALQLWQHGSGRSFLSPRTIDPQVASPFAMAAQDFDGDTWVDLLTSSASSSGAFLFRKGDGSNMTTRYTQALGNNPGLVFTADLNDDLIPDVAVTDGTTVVPALGNGLGGFQAASCASETCEIFGRAIFAQAKDLNGDGEAELVLVTEGEGGALGKVSILRHARLGARSASVPTVSGVVPAMVANNVATTLTLTGANFEAGITVTVGGVDCIDVYVQSRSQLTCRFPGKPQSCGGQSIVVTRPADQSSGTLPAAQGLRLASATLSFVPAKNLRTGRQPGTLFAADLNTDGKLDLINSNWFSRNEMSVLLGDGQGNFGSARHFESDEHPSNLYLGDINDDNKLDVVIAHRTSPSATIWLGDGLGGFGATTNLALGGFVGSIVIGDFNTDQKIDFAMNHREDSSLILFPGNGMGGFGAPSTLALPFAQPSAMGAGDLNGDGYVDLVIPNPAGGGVVILRGDGRGGFGKPVNLAVNRTAGLAQIADVNNDHNLDVVTVSWESSTAAVLLGDGRGGFGAATVIQLEQGPGSHIVRDISGDGNVDLGYISETSNDVGILLGDGTGAFGPASFFKVSRRPGYLATGDFNGDGLIDAATTGLEDAEVSILLQRCQ